MHIKGIFLEEIIKEYFCLEKRWRCRSNTDDQSGNSSASNGEPDSITTSGEQSSCFATHVGWTGHPTLTASSKRSVCRLAHDVSPCTWRASGHKPASHEQWHHCFFWSSTSTRQWVNIINYSKNISIISFYIYIPLICCKAWNTFFNYIISLL